MAHHAKIENGIVTQVIVTCDADEDTFAARMFAETGEQWVRTSYNAATNGFRFNYASIGYHWDGTGFYEQQPFASWSLDNKYQWQAPVAKPTDRKSYAWSENDLSWIEVAND